MKSDTIPLWLKICLGLIGYFYFLFSLINLSMEPQITMEEIGQFGDSMAPLAVTFLAMALFLQMDEFKHNREVTEKQTEASKANTEATEKHTRVQTLIGIVGNTPVLIEQTTKLREIHQNLLDNYMHEFKKYREANEKAGPSKGLEYGMSQLEVAINRINDEITNHMVDHERFTKNIKRAYEELEKIAAENNVAADDPSQPVGKSKEK